MSDIGFYHVTTSSLEKVLPKLLEKILEVKKRTVLMCGSQERLDYLNASLWTSGKLSFIPHGSAKEGYPEDQPIWLTLEDENPNESQFLVLTDGVESANISSYTRCLDIFDGNDEEAVLAARDRWKRYRDAGHTVTYWKQSENGNWERGS